MMTRELVLVVARPLDEVPLLVVVGDKGNSHRGRLRRPGSARGQCSDWRVGHNTVLAARDIGAARDSDVRC